MTTYCPLYGAGLGYRRSIAEQMLALPEHDNGIDFIEIAPENWMHIGGAARKSFDAAAERWPLAIHGLSLSLGGRDPLDEILLTNIKTFMRQYRCRFFSEHLSYCEHSGHLYDLLPLAFTAENVRHTAARIRRTQDILETRIAIENTSYYLHAPHCEMDEVDFLNDVAREADCDIHLDVNNIYVNAVNHGHVAPRAFIDRVDHARVSYIHIVGHDAENPRLLIDTHGEPVCDDVWDILAYTYDKLPFIPPTLLERDFNLPPLPELLGEVAHIRDIQDNAHKPARNRTPRHQAEAVHV